MNIQVSLPDDLQELIEKRVASGVYESASDVITVALRHFELQEEDDPAKLEWLCEAYRIGIESGDAGELDIEAIIAEAREEFLRRSA